MKKLLLVFLFVGLTASSAFAKSDGFFNVLQAPNDVDKTKPTNGQVLQWDSSRSLWVPTAYVDALASAVLTLTNKRITKRIVTASDATSITPNSDSADITYQLNTQATGTLTINADAGTPTNGQSWALKVKSTNVQTFAWNALYAGGANGLPTSTTGGGKIDYYTFIYDTVNSNWDFSGQGTGF